jgi:hypothetical protein
MFGDMQRFYKLYNMIDRFTLPAKRRNPIETPLSLLFLEHLMWNWLAYKQLALNEAQVKPPFSPTAASLFCFLKIRLLLERR